MKPSRDLFELVKALSKTEKRYVTLFLSSSFHGSNKNSLQLFRAISQQEEYDETALKKRLDKTITSRFSAEKNKLFELILESMLLYYRDRTEEKKINALRYEAAFLFSKNLRSAGWRYLRKATALSETVESFPTMIQLAYRENLEVRKAPPGEVSFSADEFQARNRRMVRALGEDLELYTLYTELLQLERRFGTAAGSAAVRQAMEKIIRHPLVDPAYPLDAFSSRLCRIEIRALYYKMLGNDRAALDCWDEMVAAYEASPGAIAQAYGRYSDTLLNRLQATLIAREYARFDKLLPQTRKALESIRKYFGYQVDLILFYGPELLELLALTMRADAKRGPAFLAQIEKRFRIHRETISEELRVTALYLLGTYHFYLGNLNKALGFYNDLIDSTNPNLAQNYQCMVRLVKLLLHSDLGHADLLPSLTASTARLLRKHGHLGKMEQELLAFFKKGEDPGDKTRLKELAVALQKTSGGGQSYGSWCSFAFGAWVESKLTKKALHELVAKDFMRNA